MKSLEQLLISLAAGAVRVNAGKQNAIAMNQPYTEGQQIKHFFGAALLTFAVTELCKEPSDTVNYSLYKGRKRIYTGITHKDRIATRMAEHRRNGKHFTHYTCGKPKTRSQSIETEKEYIKRYRPILNIQYN